MEFSLAARMAGLGDLSQNFSSGLWQTYSLLRVVSVNRVYVVFGCFKAKLEQRTGSPWSTEGSVPIHSKVSVLDPYFCHLVPSALSN